MFLVAGHLYLAVLHPATRHALRGMTLGDVDEDWAREHHAKWVEREPAARPRLRADDASSTLSTVGRDERPLPTHLPRAAARDRDGARARAARLAALRRRGGRAGRIDDVRRDLEILLDEGVDAVMFCNENDRPYLLEAPPGARRGDGAHRRRARAADRPFGVDYLWDARAALGVAVASGAAFMREVLPGVYESDMGLWEPDAAALLRERRAYGADDALHPHERHARVRLAARQPPARVRGRSAVVSTLADAILVSGPMAGAEPALDARARGRARRSTGAHRCCSTPAPGQQHRLLRAVRRRRDRRQRPQARRRHLEPGRARAGAALPGRRAERLSRGGAARARSRHDRRQGRGARPRARPARRALAAERAGLAASRLVGAGRGRLARQRARADPARVRGCRRRASAITASASPAGALRPRCSTSTTGRCVPRCSTTTRARTPRSTSCAPSSAPTRVLQRTGAGITQQSVGPKLRWLQRHEPAVWARTRTLAGSYDCSPSGSPEAEFSERNWALESGLYDLGDGRLARRSLRRGRHRPRCSARSAPAPRWSAASAPAAAAAHGPSRRHPGRRRARPITSRRRSRRASPSTATCSSSSAASVDILPAATARCVDERLYLDFHLVAGAVAAERLHGARRLASAGSSASSPAARRSTRSTPRPRRPRPVPAASCAAVPARREDADQRPAGARRLRRAAARPRPRAPLPGRARGFAYGFRHHLEVLPSTACARRGRG